MTDVADKKASTSARGFAPDVGLRDRAGVVKEREGRSMIPRSVGGRKVAVAALVAGATMAQAPTPARAWGRQGHRAAGRIADAYLTPKARAGVKALLRAGESLADASTVADDELRHDVRKSP